MRSVVVVCYLAASLLADEADARTCATMTWLQHQRSAPQALAMQERPVGVVGFVDADTRPIRVHYQDEALLELAELVLADVELAWQQQVEELGWPLPPPDQGEGGDDKLDVYVGVAPAAAITVSAGDSDDDDGARRGYSYILVDANIQPEQRAPFIAHELNHVLQFGVDLNASLMLFEASAVTIERLFYEAAGTYFENYPDFQLRPNAPVFMDGVQWAQITGEDLLYEYGASLFLLYLEQEHGAFDGALVRDLWVTSAQDIDDNEPDWLDVVDEVAGVSIEDAVLDFATWRVLLSGRAADQGLAQSAGLPGGVALNDRALNDGALDFAPLLISDIERPAQLGCVVLRRRATEEIPLLISARLTEDDVGELGAATMILQDDVATREVLDVRGQAIEVSLTIPEDAEGYVALCRLTEADGDDRPSFADIEVRARRTDVPLPDAGPVPEDAGPPIDGGDDEPPPVCTCQSSNSTGLKAGGAMGGMMLLGMLGFLLRARRAHKRKRLQKDYRKRDSRDQ